MVKNIIIVCSYTNIDLTVFNNDSCFIIGVERGCLDLIEKKIKIDLAVSDFDNVTNEELELIKSKSFIFEKLKPEKDLLDGEVALIKAREQSDSAKIIFISKPTKRYDMNLSAINLVNKYAIDFINDETIIKKIPQGITELNFNNIQYFTYISFFAIKKANVSIRNMKYNVENMILAPFENSAISNALILNQNPIIKTDTPIIMIATK